MTDQREALREASRGSICVCGSAKSYHGHGARGLDHEYEPRYPARRAALPSTPQPEGLDAAARRVVSEAEPDDDFDGQFVDYLVPAEALHALAVALGLAPPPPEPNPLTIEEQVDIIERTLHPEGRCVECGGGKPYWRHDPAREGSHPFAPPPTEPTE